MFYLAIFSCVFCLSVSLCWIERPSKEWTQASYLGCQVCIVEGSGCYLFGKYACVSMLESISKGAELGASKIALIQFVTWQCLIGLSPQAYPSW